ncbi:RICIN domain-containing protein [Streptomyces anulatus]
MISVRTGVLGAVFGAGLLVLAQAPVASAAVFTATLQAAHSGKCVTVKDDSRANEGAMIQYDCIPAASQKWNLTATDSGYYTVRALSSGKCLTVKDASQADEGELVQYDCIPATNQKFNLG